jgi:O-antigen ligase
MMHAIFIVCLHMPEHLRALVVILLLASMVFAFARRPAGDLVDFKDYIRWRKLWFGLTLLVFLVHDFWLYIAIAGVVLAFTARREPYPLAMFFFLLFLVPSADAQIPGFGLVNYLFAMNHPRLLALVLLLPAFLMLSSRGDTPAFGRFWADRLLAGYLLLALALQLRSTTLTDTLRQGFYLFIDVFLPYYVASRSLRDLAGFKTALFGYLLAALLLSALAVFEMTRHWLLYSALVGALGLKWSYGGYLGRSDILRASVTTGQAIALGYAVMVAIGFYCYLQQDIRHRLRRRLGGVLLTAGLIAPLSRGPWVGTVALLATYLATGRNALRRLILLGIAGLLSLSLLAALPGGRKAIDLLPFIGKTEAGNIDYRQRLLDNAIIVIKRNPWFGSVNYRDTPEMQAMVQGQGIIDIVNSYLAIGLSFGLVGLGLFVGFFALVLFGMRRAYRRIADPDDEMRRLGRALFATLVGILLTIFTVSSITIIPVVYWSVAGLGVAYAQMVKKRIAMERAADASTAP